MKVSKTQGLWVLSLGSDKVAFVNWSQCKDYLMLK